MAEAITVQVQGLNETLRALKKLGDDMEDLKDANADISSTVARAASALAPRLTGNLASSIKGNRAAKRVQIKAGGARVPYAGVIEYGWQSRGIRPQPYLRKAAYENQSYVIDKYEENIKQVIQKYDFD